MKLHKLYITAAIVCLTAAACGSSAEEQKRKSAEERAQLRAKEEKAFKIVVMPTLDCLPVFLAKDHGFFEKQGADIRLKRFTAQMDCDTALTGGSVQAIVSDLVRAERMMKQGTSLRYVTATNTYWQLIANHKARVKEVKQLGDKMMAMTRYSATDFLGDLFVSEAKPANMVYRIQINDVVIRLKMLLNNEMDAVWLTEPHATAARLAKNPVLADSRDKDLNLGVIVAQTREMGGERRSRQLEAFIKAYNEACDSINKYGTGHYQQVIEKYCQVDAATVKALPKQKFAHAAPPRQSDIDRARKAF